MKCQLEGLHPQLEIRIDIIRTTGDRLASASLAQIGGKGVFTKELEDALLDGRIDLAVHSLKDLPTNLPAGLDLAAITEREDVRDALLIGPSIEQKDRNLRGLPVGARIGTSSLRRASQLRYLRSDFIIDELRGNVETRVRKLDEGAYSAIVLATAGLVRLGFEQRIDQRIEANEMLPAVGQGALGIEARAEDQRVFELLERLDHRATHLATTAERGVLRSLGGGCAVPIAAHGRISELNGVETLNLEGLVAALDGSRIVRGQIEGRPEDAESLGGSLARKLIAQGA
ncbi:MAG: hydroxymethylbilane synthase, partial [Acidobacteriota bacterium]